MKKRLLGLLALTLCVMLLSMPVAMADTWVNDLEEGMLIPAGHKLWCVSGSLEWRIYYDGRPSENILIEMGDHTVDSDNTDGGYWLVENINEESGAMHLYLESTGPQVSGVDASCPSTSGGEFVRIGFEGLNTDFRWTASGDLISSSTSSVEKIEKAFEDYLRDHPVTRKAYFNIGVYSNTDGVLTFKSDRAAQDHLYSLSFSLPIQNASNVTVLHYNDGTVEKVSEDDKTGKVQVFPDHISVQTERYSPFMVLYDVAAAAVPSTGDNTQLALWFVLAGLSLAGVTALGAKRRKRA